MRQLFGFCLLICTSYVLSGCTSQLTPPQTPATFEADAQQYHAAAQRIVLDPNQQHRRAQALDVQDYVQWAKQSSDEQERQANLQKAYNTLQEISN